MTDDNCSDCGLAHQLHVRDDGIYECPSDTSNRGALCKLCREPMSLRTITITCPGRHVSALHDTSSEYADSSMRSETPDPLLLAPDKQLPQRHYDALRRSVQPDGAVVPLRRSTRLENRRRTREDAGPYPQTQTRRSSIRMSEDSVRFSRSRCVSLQDSRRIYGRSYENEAPLPTQDHSTRRNSLQRRVFDCVLLPPNHLTRRKSLQPHVLDRMVPVEDMEPIEGFQPFTDLDPGQLPDPVTVREPIRDIAKPPFEFVWNPSVVVPAVGGMRVRVGQFERRGNSAGDTMQFAGSSTAYEGETCSQSSGSEGYFTARDWSASSSTPGHDPSDHEMLSVDSFQYTASPPLTFPGPPQPEFIQGSSKSVLLQQQTLANDTRETNPSSWENEFPQFYALTQHYAAVQNQKKGVALPQLTPSSCAMEQIMPSAPTFTSFQQTSCNVPFTPTAMPVPTAPQPPPVEQSHARAKHPPRRSSMPGTLPGATIADYCPSEWTASTPERAETEAAVDDVEDWATREPWEYIHRVLTTSTRPLVMFLKMPTTDIPAAAQGALGADLHLQKMLIENEHWLLIGPRDVNLYEFGVKFQTRVATQDKFVFRFGNLNWGADVNQIEDAVSGAVMESSRRGRGAPAALPAQFMAGAMGGFVVWYALSLM